MTGKTYQWGVNNLCCRGTWYTLNEVVPFGDMSSKMGVVNLNIDTPVQVQAPDEGWEDNDNDDSGTILVPKVEVKDIPTEEVNEEHETVKTAQYGLGHPQYGCGMRTQNKPVSYELVMTGKTYQRGVNNLCYRGTWYTLNEVVPFGDTPYKMGVVNLNIDTPVQVQAPDECFSTK